VPAEGPAAADGSHLSLVNSEEQRGQRLAEFGWQALTEAVRAG